MITLSWGKMAFENCLIEIDVKRNVYNYEFNRYILSAALDILSYLNTFSSYFKDYFMFILKFTILYADFINDMHFQYQYFLESFSSSHLWQILQKTPSEVEPS